MTQTLSRIRDRGFADFNQTPPEIHQARSHWLMRGQNFWLEWVDFGKEAGTFEVCSMDEMMVFVPAGTLELEAAGDATSIKVPPHSVAILAAGRYRMSGGASTQCAVFTSQRDDLAGRRVINAASYEPLDDRILPTGRPYRRKAGAARMQVLEIGKIMASKDKPRLKMLQTETLSINIVEYDGPRNRAELSPHSHTSFEQGSLAIQGAFVHHLRTPWGGDADQWRDDEHLRAPSPSLLIVPMELIHTTEGTGTGHHFLVDLFSPPRADFIAKGWVFNATDYEAADDKEAS